MVRLRIALADQPGALAHVAALLAAHGGNITAVDVHQAPGSAVDDVVVEWPEGAVDFVNLRDALAESGAGALVSHQEATKVDPVVAALRRAVDIVAGGGDGEEALLAAVAEVCASPAVWISRGAGGTGTEAEKMAREGGGAVSVRTRDLPLAIRDRLPGEAWLLAVPDPGVVGAGRVVLIARGPHSEFTSTEVARIEALMDLHARVAERSDTR